VETTARRFPLAELYRLPTEEDRRLTTLEPGEIVLRLELERPDASAYLKAMDRQRFGFPLVGVAAARYGGETRLALAGAAPIPWLLSSPEDLAEATPLPGTAYKVPLARALVDRALAAVR
jgi:xanthine dehydrogenase YagS FAD-binding subunit